MIAKDLVPGKLYIISWFDILEDPRGDPNEASPKRFTHTYRFHSTKIVRDGRRRVHYYVFTAGQSPDYFHSIAIPSGCITRIEVVKQE